ncbi:unnamed protein product [Phytomonas sp. EM1]|nr:unnamed protein product [Phytomonas sp. EM1]|eukprot:CCW65004.1 unnamed protein product [Phytomonas sp. isolate EM1]
MIFATSSVKSLRLHIYYTYIVVMYIYIFLRNVKKTINNTSQNIHDNMRLFWKMIYIDIKKAKCIESKSVDSQNHDPCHKRTNPINLPIHTAGKVM